VFDFSARRTLAESIEGGSTFAINNVAGATWNHVWTARVQSTVSYVLGRISYQDLGRADTYQNFAVRVSYGLERWLRIGAEFRRDTRDSNVTGFDYERNLTLLTLEAAL
jgi:hypothetical protein